MQSQAQRRSSRRILVTCVALLGVSALGSQVWGGISGTKHDLSSASSPEKCIWCHTPHNARAAPKPLWNRAVTSEPFVMYTSPTLDSSMDAYPNGPSLLCLGCHDGVSASEAYPGAGAVSTKHVVLNYHGFPDTTSWVGCANCHAELYGTGPPANWKRGVAGVDLSNDHPISMTYPTPAQDPEFNVPPSLQNGWPGGPVLFAGKVECGTCHNVHDDSLGTFLRMSNANSALCLTCHAK